MSLNGTYFATNAVCVDFGMAYQRGRKAERLAGQTHKNLAEIPPLKTNLALNYDCRYNSIRHGPS